VSENRRRASGPLVCREEDLAESALFNVRNLTWAFLRGSEKQMRRFVARLNIDHYRQILAVETDEEKRKLIEQLLTDEEAELKAAKHKDQEQKAS
jgi:hypothetical protein